jgi:hypothetical protein
VPDVSAGRLDWVSASPTRDYVMAGYWNATVVRDPDVTGLAGRINDNGDHSDIALTADGRDACVHRLQRWPRRLLDDVG